MKTIKIKKLHPDAITPTRAHKHDAGLDLYALEDTQIRNGQCGLVKTGIAVSVPKGYEAQVRPRSGMTLKTDFKVQLGTIDSGYEGDVGIIVYNLIVSPIVTSTVKIVDEFETASERGENGFGSTDKCICPECASPSVKTFSDYESTFKKCGHCEHIFEVLQAY